MHRAPNVLAIGARFLPSTVLLRTCSVNKYLSWDLDFGETVQALWAIAIMRHVSHAFDRNHCNHEDRWDHRNRASHWQKRGRREVVLG